MTTTKEDQMRADFARLHNAPMLFNESFEKTRQDFNRGWKTCAESYEQKMDEKDARILFVEDSFIQLENQLSEANARNARLVDAIESRIAADKYCRQYSHLAEAQEYCAQAAQDADELMQQAITANSESVAAWEAEKLEPLRREVAMLHDVIGSVMFFGVTDDTEQKMQEAIDNTQATAEAYEREEQEGFEPIETVKYWVDAYTAEPYGAVGGGMIVKLLNEYFRLRSSPPQSAEQLHIKELRECLITMREEFSKLPHSLGYDLTHVPQIDKVLAKQPDTRALEKTLLEARIDQMDWVLAWHPLDGDQDEYSRGLRRALRAKLAELNKANDDANKM